MPSWGWKVLVKKQTRRPRMQRLLATMGTRGKTSKQKVHMTLICQLLDKIWNKTYRSYSSVPDRCLCFLGRPQAQEKIHSKFVRHVRDQAPRASLHQKATLTWNSCWFMMLCHAVGLYMLHVYTVVVRKCWCQERCRPFVQKVFRLI